MKTLKKFLLWKLSGLPYRVWELFHKSECETIRYLSEFAEGARTHYSLYYPVRYSGPSKLTQLPSRFRTS